MPGPFFHEYLVFYDITARIDNTGSFTTSSRDRESGIWAFRHRGPVEIAVRSCRVSYPARLPMMAPASRSILVEPSDYVLRNVGDMAMLGVAIERLARLFPEGKINVLTNDASSLARFAPAASPLLDVGRSQWLRDTCCPAPWHAVSSGNCADAHRASLGTTRRWRLRLDQFSCLVSHADLVVVAGMGGHHRLLSRLCIWRSRGARVGNSCRTPHGDGRAGHGAIADAKLRARQLPGSCPR